MLAMLPNCGVSPYLICDWRFRTGMTKRRQEAIRSMSRYLGWQAVEFARFPQYNRGNIEQIIEIEGHENFLEAQRRGKRRAHPHRAHRRVEVSSFAHAVYGYPMHFMARPLDNARLDAFVNRYRA